MSFPHPGLQLESIALHLPDARPDSRIETLFARDGDGTLMAMRIALPDEPARAAVLATGMDDGMESSHARLNMML